MITYAWWTFFDMFVFKSVIIRNVKIGQQFDIQMTKLSQKYILPIFVITVFKYRGILKLVVK